MFWQALSLGSAGHTSTSLSFRYASHAVSQATGVSEVMSKVLLKAVKESVKEKECQVDVCIVPCPQGQRECCMLCHGLL